MTPLALLVADISGNSLILVGVMVVLVFAVAFGMLRAKGSGIESHRGDNQSSPGSSGPSEESSADQGEGSATGSDGEGESNPQHGTQ